MRAEYDFVYLTNTPSFYKLNLCEEIARTHRVLIVLYGYGAEAVNTMLSEGESRFGFDFVFINRGDSNRRNKLKVFFNLCRLMRGIRCKKVLYSGWMAAEYNLYSFFSSKKKNVLICESSVFETNLNGVNGLIKRVVIGRMGAVLPSGKPHAELFRMAGFRGECHLTGSVGIFHKGARAVKKSSHPGKPLRYLYVGRLIDVKNVKLLIEAFNRNGKPLTIVGEGVLSGKLKSMAGRNITFTGFIDNKKLGEVYQSHDVFILPSYSEPWGLVVEEALYWGLPVIVSDRVGSSIDMVKDLQTGEIFRSNDVDSLQSSILSAERNYEKYREAVLRIDWEERDRNQVKAYTDLIKR